MSCLFTKRSYSEEWTRNLRFRVVVALLGILTAFRKELVDSSCSYFHRYSYFEDGLRDAEAWLSHKDIDDVPYGIVKDALIDEIPKSSLRPRATRLVQKGVYGLYATPGGEFLVNSAASVSLGKLVYGAAAISHMSKTLRTHGLTNVGTMMFNDGRLFQLYLGGKIDGATLGKKLFEESLAAYVEAVGWMAGMSIAAAFVLGPVGATGFAYLSSTVGRVTGSYIARLLTGA